MEQIEISLGEHSYKISVGHGLDYGALLKEVSGRKKDVLVVTNDVVAPLYLGHTLEMLVRAGFTVNQLVLEDGEIHKDVESYMKIMNRLLELGYGRDCILAALGGGVIGDVTGFAAATYQRGVDYVQIPTTLLAMVDSSVGGKTAINHPMGKNMVGAFYQPLCVLADIEALRTLPRDELEAGLGEVIKYGLIMDREFFDYLKGSIARVFDYDSAVLDYIVKRCCELKADVVSKDEKESSLRAILNFGHTFGHAVETHEGYGAYLHGQAVGMGMAIAGALCLKRGLLTQGEYDDMLALLRQAQLPVKIPENMGAQDFIANMRHDKKVKSGVIRYVLLDHIGRAFVANDVPDDEIMQIIDTLKANP